MSAFLSLLFSFSGSAEQPEAESPPPSQPTQTRQKTLIRSPSVADRETTGGQFKILDIEYSSRREDVPINEDKIRQNMRSTKGEAYSPQIVDQDIESLYATGDYGNVQIVVSEARSEDGVRGVRLSVMVDPKVRVSGVEVKRREADGNLDDHLSVDKEDLLELKLKALTASDEKGAQALKNAFKKKETVTQAGDILSEERLQRDAVAMEDFYRDKGYKDSRIDLGFEKTLKENLETETGEIIPEGTTVIYVKDIRRGGMPVIYLNEKIVKVASGIREDSRFEEKYFKFRDEEKIVFVVEEGNRGFIKKMRFLGNQAATTEELTQVVKLKPKQWWQIFSKSDRYEEYAMKDDIARIKNFYLNKGFIDINVTGALEHPRSSRKEAGGSGSGKEEELRSEDFNPEDIPAEDLILTYRIEEGRQYRVGNLTIEGNSFFSSDDLQNELQNKSKFKEIFDQVELKMIKADGLQPGDVYSINGLQASLETLQEKYGRRGFRESRIESRLEPNMETGMIDVNFSIKEGDKFYVDKIQIETTPPPGNKTPTQDKVIRRELDLAPNEVFDTVREKASKLRLQGLGYFEKVETYSEETDIPNRQKLIVQVKEKNTGEFSFGAGFTSVELLTGKIKATQSNFDFAKIFQEADPREWRGAGQKAEFNASVGFRSQALNASVIEPWLFDRPLRLETSGFFNSASYLSEFYTQQNYGGSVGLVRRLGDDFPLNQWALGVTYRPEFYNILDLSSDAPPYYQASVGDTLKSSLRGSITYDGRDNRMLPRSGQFFEVGAEGAGGPLLGSENIWKIRAEFKTFHHLWPEKDWILSAKAQVGLVDSYSSTEYVPVWDQLYAGGAGSVRGFSPAVFGTVNSGAVGPKQNGQPVGGSTSGIYQIEISVPSPAMENLFRIFTFCDGGFVNQNAFDFQPKTYNDTQSMLINGSPTTYNATNGGFQIGVGAGVQLMQMIPMKFSFGYPVMTGDPNNRGGVKFYLEAAYGF